MRNSLFARILAPSFLYCVLWVSIAQAQQSTAVVFGTVSNQDNRQPLSGAAVVMTSPNVQGEQMVLTDSNGKFRLPNLPPGTYSLRVFAPGYTPVTRNKINL